MFSHRSPGSFQDTGFSLSALILQEKSTVLFWFRQATHLSLDKSRAQGVTHGRRQRQGDGVANKTGPKGSSHRTGVQTDGSRLCTIHRPIHRPLLSFLFGMSPRAPYFKSLVTSLSGCWVVVTPLGGSGRSLLGHWSHDLGWYTGTPPPPLSLCLLVVLRWTGLLFHVLLLRCTELQVQRQHRQATMIWNIWNYEPKETFPPCHSLSQIVCRSGRKLINTGSEMESDTEC